MKTLDEVIETAPYVGTEWTNYALHYLRELRDMTDIPMEYFENGGTSQKLRNTSQITCPKCHSEFVILPEANNPLTWDELKQMEGKPVWMEFENYAPDWEIIENVGTFKWADGLFVETNTSILHKEDQGKTWQAYRKERSNESN